MIVEGDGSVFYNRDVISGDVSDMGVISLYEYELERFDNSMEQIQPTSTEYRELEYSDSVKQYKGEAPDTFRIYKEWVLGTRDGVGYQIGVWDEILGLKMLLTPLHRPLQEFDFSKIENDYFYWNSSSGE